MRRIPLAVLATLLAIAPGTALAGIEKAGTTAAGFLSVGAGADVLGMGGAGLGFGRGLGSGAWNVAALGGLQATEYVFSHASLSGASPQDFVAAGGRFGASRTRWGLTGLYQGDGTFEGRDASNNVTASFNASSMAVGFQVAQPMGDVAALGFGVKYASEKLGDVTGGGVTFDAGLRVQAGPLGFGAAAQNAFGRMTYSGATYDFPTNYGAGVAYTLPASGLTLAVDANFPNAYYSDVRGGVEWRYRDRVALRTGYRKELGAEAGEPLGGPTFGMGAGVNGFWVDYGFLTGGASGSGQHRIGLTYRPGFMNGESVEQVAEAPRRVERAPTRHTAPAERAVVPMREEKVAPAPVAATKPEKLADPAPAPARTVVEAPKPAPAKPVVTATEAPKPAPAKPVTGKAPSEPAKAAIAKPATVPAATKPVTPPPAAPKVEKPAAEAAPAATKPATAKAEAPKPAVETKTVAPKKPAVVEPKAEPARAAPAPPKVERAPAVETPKPEAPKPAPVEVSEPVKPAPAEKPVKAEKETPRPEKVKVKSGETLADIAKRWGTSAAAIMMENNLVSEQVKPGQTLKLPPRGR